MNAVNTTLNNATAAAQAGIHYSAYTVTHSEPLLKALKITNRFIEGAAVITNISKAFNALSSHLKDTILFIDSVRVFGVIQLLSCPDENGKYFLTNSQITWQKRADRVNLLFHCTFKSMKGLIKAGFMKYGFMAKEVIGKLPLFHLTMDSFILLSSGFGIWDTMVNPKGFPVIQKKMAFDEAKIAKWNNRLREIDLLRINDEPTRLAFAKKYEKKSLDINKILEDNTQKILLRKDKINEVKGCQDPEVSVDQQNKIVKECSATINKLELERNAILEKQLKNDSRLEKIYARDCKGLADDLAKQPIKEYKIKKWETQKQIDSVSNNKNKVRLANNIGKITIVSIALIFTAILGNFWTAPYILTVLAIGIAVDSIGLTKLLYEQFAKAPVLPKKAAMAA